MAKLNASQLAEQYGYALSFLKSDSSLWKLFNSAVSGNWTADKFTAELKNTAWYKKNGESVRQYEYLASTDPASLQAKIHATLAQLKDAATQEGATIGADTLLKMATNALKFGWNDAQIRDQLSSFVKAVNGVYSGDTGSAISAIQQTAWRNGLKFSDPTIQKWAQSIAAGNLDQAQVQAMVRQQAKSLAPAYADQLNSGMDLFDIAQPYMQSMAKTLELNPTDIDLFDPTIRKAMSATDAQGKPASQSIWQFEQGLRQDPRWTKTQNAQDSLFAAGHQVLQAFGFRF